jgi:hypothetical protein
MEKWEYFTLRSHTITDVDLNYYGKRGWELVSVDGYNYYFKKRNYE